MQQALVDLAGIGSGIAAPQWLAMLAEWRRKVGRHDEALGGLGLGVAQAEQLALAPVYEWFTKGFDTRDLQHAKAPLRMSLGRGR